MNVCNGWFTMRHSTTLETAYAVGCAWRSQLFRIGMAKCVGFVTAECIVNRHREVRRSVEEQERDELRHLIAKAKSVLRVDQRGQAKGYL